MGKANQKLERSTTAMFPSRKNAPTEKSYMKEMSEGIVELNDQDTTEVDEDDEDEEESISKNGGVLKPKTRRQKRDKRKRMFEEQKVARERELKIKEIEVSRLKSIKKELKSDEALATENEEKRRIAKEEKIL